ncbi:hypothetical protein [Streptomyces sp. NPDC088719]|uniref:hypothetical protein n=1 Tax=Streptomyces sp. NPDC088719 TaxID=3365872 RepID=UPI0037F933CC
MFETSNISINSSGGLVRFDSRSITRSVANSKKLTGLSLRCFDKLVTALRSEGADAAARPAVTASRYHRTADSPSPGARVAWPEPCLIIGR